MSKPKFPAEVMRLIVNDYLSGKGSYKSLAQQHGIGETTLKRWVIKYQEQGIDVFLPKSGNNHYSKEFKLKCVKAALSGEGSINYIAAKYNISNESILWEWIKRYNANKELKDYNINQEVHMADARRKTTLEERKEITEYCIAHGKDYKGTAALYNVSYSQVYSWVQKYLSNGEDGLTDRRGHHKADDELDELERLRRENIRLKRQLEEQNMVVELLKKVKEFERM